MDGRNVARIRPQITRTFDSTGGRRAGAESEDDTAELFDGTPGSDVFNDPSSVDSERLKALAREAGKLYGKPDSKLQNLVKHVKLFLKDGYSPIIFCRFIDTADYVAAELRSQLKGVEVASVTGTLPPKERVDRI